MSKTVLILSGSPRKGGNSDTLCEQFRRGCIDAGTPVTKIDLREKDIRFCKACYACRQLGRCVQQDDMNEIAQQMVAADVIVLATPVYFYSMAGQVKTLIDRCLACGDQLANKEFYFIATAADGQPAMERTMDGLRGFTDCLPGAVVKGCIYGAGAWQLGDIQGMPAMEQAYRMGLAACGSADAVQS